MNRERIIGEIVKNARVVVPALESTAINPELSLGTLGLDSVERHEVLILTLEAIGLDVPLVALHGPRNIGELAELLHAKLLA